MIYHVIRMKLRDDVSPAQLDEALQALDDQGHGIPVVKFFAAGREHGGGFDRSAIFGFADLQAYQEYLTHPLHKRSERIGFPLMENFEMFDLSASAEPDLGTRIAEMQRTNLESDPELVELVSGLESTFGTTFNRGDVQP